MNQSGGGLRGCAVYVAMVSVLGSEGDCSERENRGDEVSPRLDEVHAPG